MGAVEQAPFDVDQQLRQHGRALRHLARGLLRDEADVDDALQNTWLRALRRPPHHLANVGGWLATLLRNTIHLSHTREQRRVRRERLAARSELGPDHADTLARAEMAQRLLAIVQRLEPPFRDAIWQRYFEDLPPREIAARSGVPLATVKSRLQRGLQQLREQLGEGGESDWRAGLALAFGFGAERAATAGTVAVIAGGVGMATWLKVATGMALMAVAVWGWWQAPPAAPAANPSGGGAISSSHATAPVHPPAGGAEPQQTMREAVAVETASEQAPTAMLQGRCVDANGEPLADCVVQLDGEIRSYLIDAWLRDHAAPQWQDFEQTTRRDGRFAFSFGLHAAVARTLRITRPGSGLLSGFVEIEAGKRVDVGDITLLPGVQVAGTVVDGNGRPVSDIEVHIDTRPAARPMFGVSEEDGERPAVSLHVVKPDAISGEDGRFRMPTLVAPGNYVMHLSHSPRCGGRMDAREVELRADRPVEDLTLVCSVAADAPTIRGTIVDENGIGLPKATLWSLNGLADARAWSGPDGSFLVRRQAGDTDRMEFFASLAGYALDSGTKSLAWGEEQARVVLRRGAILTIAVVDPDSRAVRDFSVRALPHRDGSRPAFERSSVRTRGPFANGAATIPGLWPGTWRIALEFPTASGLVTQVEDVEMTGEPAQQLFVRAETAVTRKLRVVTTDGAPAVGIKVEVFDYVRSGFGTNTDVQPLQNFLGRTSDWSALLVDSGTTDADGSFVMRGSSRRPQGLRLSGPGYMPHCDAAVSLREPSDLVVTMRRGAHLIARITQPDVIDELRRRAGLEAGAAFGPGGAPFLQLSRTGEDGRIEMLPPTIPRDGQALMDAAGRFELHGIPPDTWQVSVRHWHMSGPSGANLDEWKAAAVTLVDGATTEITLDLASILPGTLEGRALQNGQPMADQNVSVVAPGARNTAASARTDAEGRFVCQVPAGTYSLRRWCEQTNGPSWLLTSTTTAQVRVGATTQQTFDLWTGTLRVTLLDDTGAPAADVALFVDDGRDEQRWLAPTDASGVVQSELPVGVVTLKALPRRLQDDEEQDPLRERPAGAPTDPLAAHRLTLGTVTIRADQPTAIELQLPPEWSR